MAELTVPQIDFSALGQLPQVYKAAQADQLRQQTLASLGQGGQVDANTLLKSGDLSLVNLGVQMQNRQADQSRQSLQDSFQREEAARAQRNSDRSFGLQERAATRADEGPVETAQQRAQAARANGIDPTTPAGKAYVLTGKLPENDTTFTNTIEQRKQAAVQNGLDPSSPGYQSFVLTGKMPREDAQPLTAGDKAAIREADDAVLSNRAAIDSLGRAKTYSKDAFVGPTAGVRGYVSSFLGDSSDIGKGGLATENLTNEVMTNALGQLKSIFGGNPTEGERKILLDIQGAVNKPDNVRQAIFDRARAAAQNRLEFNQRRADELRGNTYYKPKTAQPTAPASQGGAADSMLGHAREALAAGAPREAVLQRLQAAGIDPSGL
jgi:hypothetical protein